MTTTTAALLVDTPNGSFRAGTIERRALRPTDIRIDIAYAGICHSDIHQVREEWGKAAFPMVPGHEIAGVVTEVGSAASRYAVGDRVGVGCMVDSCLTCEPCRAGHENWCENRTIWTYNDTELDGTPTYGGYSRELVVHEAFAARIPDSIGLDAAAPLLCAGVTTWTPLRRWVTRPGMSVAVVGMGGLGHLGVKLAAAMGSEVTVLSHTASKKADGLSFGASEYIATSEPGALKPLRGRFDVILSTVSADLPLDQYLRLLRPEGVMVDVGLPEHPQSFNFASLVLGDKVLAGSGIGGMPGTQAMLDFCGEHGIGASIETIDAAEVDAAYDRVVGSDVRYRFVIDTSTIQA